MRNPDPENQYFRLAEEFILQTNQSVFLTGKAGTGKTTFLRHIRNTSYKPMAVLAPTGVAAINAGGSTIHSFFQLPLGPFVPVSGKGMDGENVHDKHSLLRRLRYNADKRNLLRSIELLIIDEVSMVRADMMDAIDTVLRYYRNNGQPFGGVQMLLIGDMYQLPPVVRDEEWQMLAEYYSSPFFFSSQVIQAAPPVYIELETIYRQSEQQFVDLLNEVRNNRLTPEGLQLLNSRYQPNFFPRPEDGYITLSTHNYKADEINQGELNRLSGRAHTFTADIEGDFPEKNYPAEETLVLKEGAQVMFIRNDINTEKRFYNGKIGVVTGFEEGGVQVRCNGEDEDITVDQAEWENMQYHLNRELQQVEEKKLGTFRQLPLRLAWAVTIHKSQGLTFDKVIIDAGRSFSPGQVYVALSRCTTLNGVVLYSQIPPSAVFTDTRVGAFATIRKHGDALMRHLEQSRRNFQQQLLFELFDGDELEKNTRHILAILKEHDGSFGEQATGWATSLHEKALALADTAGKFRRQMLGLFQDAAMPEDNPTLQERIRKGASWFLPQLGDLLSTIKEDAPQTDSREKSLVMDAALGECFKVARQWQQQLLACQQEFRVATMLKARTRVNIAEIIGLSYAGSGKRQRLPEIDHPALYKQLKQVRDRICHPGGLPIYLVASSKTLEEMAQYLPQTREELLLISGFGEQKVEKYGEAFLEVLHAYCKAHQLKSRIEEKHPKRQRKTKAEKPVKVNSKLETYRLWQEGMSITEIAETRGFQPSTIEGHLEEYVLSGAIARQAIVPDEQFEQIKAAFLELQTQALGEVKAVVGDGASFGQIRLVRTILLQDGSLTLPAPEPASDAALNDIPS